MINYLEKTAGITKIETIAGWKVLFHVSFLGIVLDLDQALELCKEKNFDPNLAITPLVAAITETQLEVIFK